MKKETHNSDFYNWVDISFADLEGDCVAVLIFKTYDSAKNVLEYLYNWPDKRMTVVRAPKNTLDFHIWNKHSSLVYTLETTKTPERMRQFLDTQPRNAPLFVGMNTIDQLGRPLLFEGFSYWLVDLSNYNYIDAEQWLADQAAKN